MSAGPRLAARLADRPYVRRDQVHLCVGEIRFAAARWHRNRTPRQVLRHAALDQRIDGLPVRLRPVESGRQRVAGGRHALGFLTMAREAVPFVVEDAVPGGDHLHRHARWQRGQRIGLQVIVCLDLWCVNGARRYTGLARRIVAGLRLERGHHPQGRGPGCPGDHYHAAIHRPAPAAVASLGSANATSSSPRGVSSVWLPVTATATYCLPFTSYVIGGALTAASVFQLHSLRPLWASYAISCLSDEPVKTTPPAVANTPLMI